MNGYAHLDIKPDNILLDTDCQLRLADFDFLTRTDAKKFPQGTRNARAPEVRNSNTFDPTAADIFATGVTLFALHNKRCYPLDENIPQLEEMLFNDPK